MALTTGMQKLKERMLSSRLTLSVAESLTCGNLQARIGMISGASGFFLGGVTAYSLEQKNKILGVPREIAEQVNCVSEEVAVLMAQGARGLFGSDIAIATTGYAESAPGQEVSVPFAWWAIVDHDKTITGRVECPHMTRIMVQHRVAEVACDALIESFQP